MIGKFIYKVIGLSNARRLWSWESTSKNFIMLTYKQAYDKIIDAYFKDEIKPMEAQFCFCGTLCNNTTDWFMKGVALNRFGSHGYSGKELGRMEWELIFNINNWWVNILTSQNTNHKKYEDALFAGMSAALEVLKQIHIERGEVIDELEVKFTKRELVKI